MLYVFDVLDTFLQYTAWNLGNSLTQKLLPRREAVTFPKLLCLSPVWGMC